MLVWAFFWNAVFSLLDIYPEMKLLDDTVSLFLIYFSSRDWVQALMDTCFSTTWLHFLLQQLIYFLTICFFTQWSQYFTSIPTVQVYNWVIGNVEQFLHNQWAVFVYVCVYICVCLCVHVCVQVCMILAIQLIFFLEEFLIWWWNQLT